MKSSVAETAQLAVAGTFTIEGLAPALELLIAESGLALELRFAPYHQVFQELLTPGSTLSSLAKGVAVVVVRLEDFVRDVHDVAAATTLVADVERQLIEAAGDLSGRSKVPVVYLMLDPASSDPQMPLGRSLADATRRLAESLKALPGATVLGSASIDPLCAGERLDPIGDELGHVPYTEEYLAAMALAVTRAVHALLVPAHKVLVLDCDNTVWKGVVGEDGPAGISFPEPLLELQRFAVKVQSEGTLVCLASKNTERDVIEAFELRAEMPLRLEHVVEHRINWEPKSLNLASLAQSLNLGLDSFVFIDDNPVECAQMRAELPQVTTLLLPPLDEVGDFLEHLWTFDRAALTEEDLRRTAMYRQNAARQAAEGATSSIADFISALQIEIDVRQPADADWSRLSQLTQKTNQFNFSTVRRTEAELRALAQGGAGVWCVNVRDRFGDYGLVGLAIAAFEAPALRVDTFLLSCRVLGRGVEHAVIRKLAEEAEARGLASVELPFRKTAKNEPAQAFADSIAAAWRSTTDDLTLYAMPAHEALQIQHVPGADPEAIVKASKSETAPRAATATSTSPTPTASRSDRYTRLASALCTGKAVLEATRVRGSRQRALSEPVTAASNEVERQLIAIWEDTLGVQGIGVTDDFTALGGTSLLAVRVFAAIARELGTTLPITTIVTANTVRALAEALARAGSANTESLVPFKVAGPNTLYLVHEGNGETLLYLHLARHLPADLSVFGVQPASLPKVPLAHDSMESMASHYVDAIVRRQPHGEIFLGGLCAGGVISFEMAHQLRAAGRKVGAIFLMDSATPQAGARVAEIASPRGHQRGRRAKAYLGDTFRQHGALAGAAVAARFVANRLSTIAQNDLRELRRRARLREQLRWLQRVLHEGAAWPASVRPMSTLEIYNISFERYEPVELADVPTVLVRPTADGHDDRSFITLFDDPLFGWAAVAPRLDVVDVPGGHASMFTEPHVSTLAAVMRPRLGYPDT